MTNIQNPLIFWLKKTEDINAKKKEIQNTKRGIKRKIYKSLFGAINRIEDEALLELNCLSLVSQKGECTNQIRLLRSELKAIENEIQRLI
jgi:hypothetical protein